jgi:hypothetical protein
MSKAFSSTTTFRIPVQTGGVGFSLLECAC